MDIEQKVEEITGLKNQLSELESKVAEEVDRVKEATFKSSEEQSKL